ncbi:15567_t:CDS:2, partial [Gigaspora rosea]
MPILVFDWNDAGFNDVPTAPGFRNGITGQTKNGHSDKSEYTMVKNQSGVQNVCNSVTRINQITYCDTDDAGDTEPLTTFDIENFSH